MAIDTYYTVLGVSEAATQAEIKSAWRERMKQVHPDAIAAAPEYWKKKAEAEAKEVNEAYQVLSDSSKRKQYDQQLAVLRTPQTPKHQTPPSSPHYTHATGPTPVTPKSAPPQKFGGGRLDWPITLTVILAFIICIIAASSTNSQPTPQTGQEKPVVAPTQAIEVPAGFVPDKTDKTTQQPVSHKPKAEKYASASAQYGYADDVYKQILLRNPSVMSDEELKAVEDMVWACLYKQNVAACKTWDSFDTALALRIKAQAEKAQADAKAQIQADAAALRETQAKAKAEAEISNQLAAYKAAHTTFSGTVLECMPTNRTKKGACNMYNHPACDLYVYQNFPTSSNDYAPTAVKLRAGDTLTITAQGRSPQGIDEYQASFQNYTGFIPQACVSNVVSN